MCSCGGAKTAVSFGAYEAVWGHLEDDHAGWKDPAPVVDEATGRLFYFMNTNESEKRLFYMTSDDNGYTWSDPIRVPDICFGPNGNAGALNRDSHSVESG